MATVLFGSLGLVLALAAVPKLGLGLSLEGVAGAILIVFFGFLFVTVSSRLTGEIGSSSNPISGMTVATLLFTCLAFVLIGRTGHGATLTAITVAAVVCVAASNGGSTAQDLKTGYLIGATPRKQQFAILIGLVIAAGVVYEQRQYATHEALRVDTDQVLIIRTHCLPVLEDRLRAIAGVRGVACSAPSLLTGESFGNFTLKDGSISALDINPIEPGVLDMLGLQPEAGRFPMPLRNEPPGLVINESAARRFGYSRSITSRWPS